MDLTETLAPPLPETELDALELKVARRADELVALHPTYGSMRLEIDRWLRAEREILGDRGAARCRDE